VAQYEYVAVDLLTGVKREEVPLTGVRWGHKLNGAGTFTGNIHYHHPKATADILNPGNTALYVERNGVPVWGGIIWTMRKIKDNDLLSIGAEGFHSYFKAKRSIRNTLTFASKDQLAIARDLYKYAQGEALVAATGTPTFPQPGGSLGVTFGAETSGVLRDRTYWSYERKSVGLMLEQLAGVQNGFDFSIEIAKSGSTYTRQLAFWYPRRGIRTNRTFEQGANVTLLGWFLDAKATENRVDAIGAGEGDSMLIATAQDTSLLTEYPVFDGYVSKKDVSVQSTLQAHADRELAARKKLVAIPAFTIRATPDSDIGGFITGDEVKVVAADGFVQINGFYRIQEYVIDVSNEGDEQIDMTFIDTEAFA
jgi:hypothetical protein